MSQSVMITRFIADDSPLPKALRNAGFELLAVPMIRTIAMPFQCDLLNIQWVFFSSSNAVKFFLENTPPLNGKRLAAIGKSTAAALRLYEPLHFVGNGSDIESIAKNFAMQVKDERVLFPISAQSLRTIQIALPTQQIENVVCYDTIENPVEIGFPDILVFSSPSNVHAFFRKNKILDYQKIIAFGKATAEALAQYHCENISIPPDLDDDSLLHAIIG